MRDDTPAKAVHVSQMGKHFLYLPFYFALENDFFGHIPSEYREYRIENDFRPSTDVQAYDFMMSSRPENENVLFALTDPIQVLRTPKDASDPPVILVSLIINAAFWAVNHGSVKVKFLRDLASFDKLISFAKGTTSYGIASRIYLEGAKSQKKTDFIVPVERGQELTKLVEFDGNGTAVALSPDLLKIEHTLKNHRDCHLELALGRTPEYSSVMVTALLTKRSVVTEHRKLISGMLSGLRQALIDVQNEESTVIKFAGGYFTGARRVVSQAIRSANDAQVYPSDITISEPHWMNAVRAHTEANARTWGVRARNEALAYYNLCVKPFGDLLVEARRVPPVPTRSNCDRKRVPLRTSLIALAVTLVTALGFLIHYPAPILCIVLGGIYIYCTSSLPCFAKWDFWRYLHYGLAIVAILLSALILTLTDFRSNWSGYATVTGIPLSLDIGLIIARLNKTSST